MTDQRHAATTPLAPPTSTQPWSAGPLSLLGGVWAVLVIGVGVVGIRDGLVYAGPLGGTPWVETVASDADHVTPAIWMLLAGAAAVVFGLLLLAVAIRPRSRAEIQVRADTDVFLTRRSLARMATATADRVEGVDAVETVSVSTSGERLTITISTWSDTPDSVCADVTEQVTRRVSRLSTPPTVRVHLNQTGAPS